MLRSWRSPKPAGRKPSQVQLAISGAICEPILLRGRRDRPPAVLLRLHSLRFELGSLIKKRRKKMSKHKYRKRQKANRHKKK